MVITTQKLKEHLLLFTLIGLLIIVLFSKTADAGNKILLLGPYISIAIKYLSIIIFTIFAYHVSFKNIPLGLSFLYGILISWFLFQIIRGSLIADNYWEYKFLFFNSITFSMISLVFFMGKELNITKYIIQKYLYIIIPLAFILLPLTFHLATQLFSRLVIPITMMILFVPYIPKKWIIIFTIVLTVSVISEPGFRTGFIKIVISLLLLFGHYTTLLYNKIIKNIAFSTILMLPFILLTLGITGTYNVFEKLSENISYEVEENNMVTNMNSDTRTFLYMEVLEDLIQSKNLLFGKSPSQGYKSLYFYNSGGAIDGIRYASEVNILNILLHFGLLGCLLMVLLVVSIAYYGIFKSKNNLAIMLGFILLSRYTLFFIEEFTQFNFNFFFFWLIMGLVASNKFRKMSEFQVKLWIRSNFNKSYDRVLK